MSARLSRRRALAASAAAALGLGTAVGIPMAADAAVEGKSPATAPSVSAEAAALRTELARVSCEYRTACREVDETGERVDYPDPPEALYVRPGDRARFFTLQPDPSWSDKAAGRDWWALPATVERLRGATFCYVDGRQDAQAVARRNEVVAAFDRWQTEDKAAEDAAGHTAALERFEAALRAYRAFRLRLVELRTDDPDVLTVKALAIVDLCNRDPGRLDLLIAQDGSREGGPGEAALALSMARDFIGLFGRVAWVQA